MRSTGLSLLPANCALDRHPGQLNRPGARARAAQARRADSSGQAVEGQITCLHGGSRNLMMTSWRCSPAHLGRDPPGAGT